MLVERTREELDALLRGEPTSREVSEGTLIKRINRQIGGLNAKSGDAWGKRLHRCRGDSDWFGHYYTTQIDGNVVVDTHVDLESYAREVGALADNEKLAA